MSIFTFQICLSFFKLSRYSRQDSYRLALPLIRVLGSFVYWPRSVADRSKPRAAAFATASATATLFIPVVGSASRISAASSMPASRRRASRGAVVGRRLEVARLDSPSLACVVRDCFVTSRSSAGGRENRTPSVRAADSRGACVRAYADLCQSGVLSRAGSSSALAVTVTTASEVIVMVMMMTTMTS